MGKVLYLPKFLETRENKQISSYTLAELAKIVLKIICLNLMKKFSNKNVEPQLEQSLHLLMLFFLWLITWEHDEEPLRAFIDQVNLCHPAIKFIAEYSKREDNFLHLNI